MTGDLDKKLKVFLKHLELDLKRLKHHKFNFNKLKLSLFNLNQLKIIIFINSKFRNLKLRYIIAGFALIFILGFIFLLKNLYNKLYEPNVTNSSVIYIPTGSDYQQVINILKDKDLIRNIRSFNWVAKRKMYPSLVRPGAYKIEKGWNNSTLIDRLRSGVQTPVKVTFNNIRFREDLAGRLSRYLEADSVSFLNLLNNDSLANHYGFTHENFICLFLPNTYEFYWTVSPIKFIERMKKEYDIFWNESRRSKAEVLGLSPQQVITLASIIQDETNKNDEKPRMAGVYLNRLRRGWLLQADPTIKFAMHNYSVKRILKDDLNIDSPYNTYKYAGLPPGPINFPDISSIDAVLNAEKNDYLYFCAKADFSGYHNFARTLNEHNINVAKYQHALNKNRIFR